MSLFSFLRLDNGADEEAATLALTAIITSAVHDDTPEISLSEVYRQVANNNGSEYLDALHVLPALLQSEDPAARDLISLIGECSPAREVAIATQEALERLKSRFDSDDDSDNDEVARSAVDTFGELLSLYTSVIPRIKLRNRSAFETTRPYIVEIQEVVDLAGQFLSTGQSQSLLLSISHLIDRIYHWLESKDSSTATAKPALYDLLLHSLSATAQTLDAGMAQRTFEAIFPRLIMRTSEAPGSETADQAISAAWTTYKLLGKTKNDLARNPSQSSLVLLAHLDPSELSDKDLLPSFLPILIASIQSNSSVDYALAFLLKVIHKQEDEFPANILAPLCTTLPTLASGHPDPQMRHQAFRILSLLLSRSPPPLRLQVLQDLASNSEFPQMRVAAVGLIKEAALEALGASQTRNNIFGSSAFLRTFGPIIFRPHPPDVFESSPSMKDFEESQESKRLVECLSLYYILLMRDETNLTGVRDAEVARNIDNNLLKPLRKQLKTWTAQSSSSDHLHGIMPLVSLQMSLDRIDSAREKLKA